MIIDDIYQIFKDYYGEDKVDLQTVGVNTDIKECYNSSDYEHYGDYIIVVHWPEVTVSNEFDASIVIWDLYAAIFVSPVGILRGYPLFNRSTYDNAQWVSRYMHSHTPGINVDSRSLSRFTSSCLGNGPLVNTTHILRATCDMDRWNLLCWELDKYVRVESLSGGPYKRLQNVSLSGKREHVSEVCIKPRLGLSSVSKEALIDLTSRLMEKLINDKVLKFSYNNGKYEIGVPYLSAVLDISNCFIEMYNSNKEIRKTYTKDYLFDKLIIEHKCISNNMIYTKGDGKDSIIGVLNTPLFTFKGNKVLLKLKDFEQDYTANEVILLNLNIIDYILYNLLKHINLKYGKSTDTISEKSRVL